MSTMTNYHATRRTGYLLAALLLALAACKGDDKPAAPAEAQPQADANPWPQVTWPLPDDPALEKRITELMATMTVEEKVGQLVQGDIASITPDDVRK
jgi:beta-glucosidase